LFKYVVVVGNNNSNTWIWIAYLSREEYFVQLFSFPQQLSKSLKIFFKKRRPEKCKSQSQYCPRDTRLISSAIIPIAKRQLRASVSFPIIELGLQEALEGESFAKARRLHKSG